MIPEERVARLEQGLSEAREKISPYYDEVFREVQQRFLPTAALVKLTSQY